MERIAFVLLTFLVSVGIGWFAVPRVVVIAKMKRLFDEQGARRTHTGAVPRLGGLIFFPAALFSFAFVLGLRFYLGMGVRSDWQEELVLELLFVVSGMLILYFVGMADDLIGVGYRSKFVAQILAGVCLVLGGVTIRDMQGLFMVHHLPFWVDAVLTVGVVVLTINAFNLIDGVDGLCSGLGILILGSLGAFYTWAQMYVHAMFAFGMVGVLIAFFQYNVLGTRLKIFMGDTGALTLGFMVIFLGIKFIDLGAEGGRLSALGGVGFNCSLAILVGLLFVPIFDTCRVFVSRISRGKSPFYPDKNHIHHKLLQLMVAHHQEGAHLRSTAILLGLQIGYIALNVGLSQGLGWGVNWIVLTDVLVGVAINVGLNRAIGKYGRPIADNRPDRHTFLGDK